MQSGSICAIHQPNFLPRLTTLAKLYAADCWVVLDNVQFVRRDYQHRARLAALHDSDAWQWVSLPVHLPAGRGTTIADVQLTERTKTRRRVDQLLQQYYRRSPHWPQARALLDEVLATLETSDRLATVAEVSARAMLAVVGWQGTIVRASNLPSRAGRSERLVDLTRAVGSRRYLCGTGGATYLDRATFLNGGIDVKYFMAPQDASGTWRGASRNTALWAVMTAGPAGLAAELREHARAWRE